MHSQPPSRGEVPIGRVLTSQNVYTASSKAKQQIEELLATLELGDIQRIGSHMEGTSQTLYELLISQSLLELIRHVLLLNKAMVECGTRLP